MEWWNLILLDPILNFLIVLSKALFSNFGLAIIALTIIVRLVMLPLTLKQLHSSKVMSDQMRELQPKLQQLQKKYAKDKAKLQQETMKLYKESGVNPLGCLTSPMLITMLIQMPIFVALYQAIIRVVAVTPQDFLGLSEHLYSWSVVRQALPVSGSFLWLNLGSPDQYLLIPLLVGATMWVSQKMMTQPAIDPSQQSMQGMMQLMMPLMFAFITFTLPSGLGLYFVVTNIIGIVIQYRVYGWGNLFPRKQTMDTKVIKPEKPRADVAPPGQISNLKGGAKNGKHRDKRQDSTGSRSARPGAVGPKPGGGGGHRSKER